MEQFHLVKITQAELIETQWFPPTPERYLETTNSHEKSPSPGPLHAFRSKAPSPSIYMWGAAEQVISIREGEDTYPPQALLPFTFCYY